MELQSFTLIFLAIYLQFCYIEGAVTETPASVTFSGSGTENTGLMRSIPEKIKRYALPVLGGAVLIGIACCCICIKRRIKRCCQGLEELKEVIIHKPEVGKELISLLQKEEDDSDQEEMTAPPESKKPKRTKLKTLKTMVIKKKKKGLKHLYKSLKKKSKKKGKKWRDS